MAFEVYDVNLHDVDAVMKALKEASAQAKEEGRVMTQIRLAYMLGLSKNIFGDILNDRRVVYKGRKVSAEVVGLIKKAAEYCELCVSDSGFAARNPAMSIFVLKAVHGYDDKPQSGANNSVTVVINDSNIPD